MLWYKGWLETRFKLLAAIAMTLFFLNIIRIPPQPSGKMSLLGAILMMNNIAMGMACTWLAGAGIATQPAFRDVKGIQGSTLFTLSLPVSRSRLLSVRAALGWLLLAGLIALISWGIWMVFPAIRNVVSGADMCEYAVTLLAGASVYYCAFVLLATFLEEMWRVFGGLIGFWGWRWISKHAALPAYTNIYRMMGDDSPLKTHHMPWNAIFFSIGLSAALFLVALKVVRTREY